MVQTYSIVAFQNTSALVIVEEDNKLKKLILQKNIHTDKITTYGSFVHADKQYFYTGSFDKFIKFWTIEGENVQLVNSSVVQKKITHSFYSKEINTHFVTDKYGDIYSFNIEMILKKEGDLFPEYQNNNLAIQQAFKDITVGQNTTYCVLGDSYSKIKLFDIRNMHELVNVWVPFEGHLISIVEFQDSVIFLYQMKDSETLEKRFVLHHLSKSKFNDSNYHGEKIEGVQFADNATKVRIEKKNDNELAIYSLTKQSDLTVQLYNIQQKALVKSESSKLSFALEQNQALFLHSQKLNNSTIAIVGVKSKTGDDIQLEDCQDVDLSSSLLVKQIYNQTNLIVFS